MALPKSMGKSSIAMKKKSKGTVTKATIGAPAPDTPTPSTPDTDTPSIPSSPSSPSGNSGGKNWIKPVNTSFTPEGIPNDDNWHHDDAHIVSEHMMNYGKSPLDVVHYWASDNGAALKRAQPFDPQHGDYSGFGGVGNPRPDGPPGYVNAPGQSTPKSKPAPPKPSGDQHANKGSFAVSSAEAIRNMPGSYATGITNGMTNRDKYVK